MSNENLKLEIIKADHFYADENGLSFKVLENINFDLNFPSENSGYIHCFLAPKNSGSSTLLKIIAGLIKPTNGQIRMNSILIEKPTGKIVYIPEDPSSYPWLNVIENIKYVSKSEFFSSEPEDEKIDKILKLVELEDYRNHYPHNKSRGFRFRISLAMSLLLNPSAIIIDNIFKCLSSETKQELYNLILKIKTDLKINFIIATNNISEAITLSDSISLMKPKPGTIFDSIELNQANKIDGRYLRTDYLTIRNQIESKYENIYELNPGSFSI